MVTEEKKTQDGDDWVMIRVRRSTRESLNNMCPEEMKPEYFRDRFIQSSIEHRELVQEALAAG